MGSVRPYKTRIKGSGHYLPEGIISNHDLEKMVDTNDQWIIERTGIKRRHKTVEGEYTSDIAYKAAQIALKEANVAPDELDMILFATVSPDQVMPNTACVLQAKLGAGNCAALDISAACSGFVYGLSVAHQFVASGMYKNILLVGAEVLHPYVNYKDRNTCILFGDGAGAAVIGRTEEGQESDIFSTHLHADGHISDLFVLPAGGSKMPFTQEVLDNESQYVRMKGKEIFKHAVRTMSLCCKEALEANDIPPEKVDWIVPHQANVRIIEAVAKHFGVPMEKVVVEIEDMGNTSAATVPVAFDKAVKDGRIKRGDIVLLTAFGAGITSGSAIMRY